MSNTQLEELLVGQPQDIQAEIIRINTDARTISLQVALLVPLLAALVGLFNAFRMMRLPDPAPSGAAKAWCWADVRMNMIAHEESVWRPIDLVPSSSRQGKDRTVLIAMLRAESR